MKRLLTLAAAVVPMMAASLFAADGITAAGSKHNFTAASWSDGEVCKPCHTPHNAVAATMTGRLWAHDLSEATYTYHGGSSTPFDGTTRLDGATGSLTQSDLDTATRLCLSCHDGTVALDSFQGRDAETSSGVKLTGVANLGTDLSNDHPVGLKAIYNDTYAPSAGHYVYKPLASVKDSGPRLKFAKTTVLYGSTVGTTTYGTTNSAGTVSGNMYAISCVTCHDVHNGQGHTDGLLRMSNDGSALCLACHNK
jgi:predicted CXXCH cytochrome family protein